MFGLKRHLEIRRYRQTQHDRVSSQLALIDAQLDACHLPETHSLREGYVYEYILGILDAITSTYESETRRRVGLELHRDVFMAFLRTRLACGRREARRIFNNTRAICIGNPLKAGIIDGHSDGLAAMRHGHKPHLLQRHLAQGHAA
jgi:hypothetical protein